MPLLQWDRRHDDWLVGQAVEEVPGTEAYDPAHDNLAEALELRWIEEGGPAVAAPSRNGFGTAVLGASIRHQLDGTVNLEWRPEGLRATIILPRSHLVADDRIPAEEPLTIL
ncbi:MAG TPA: hypothetical protein VED40_00870 [Azospirillaceae bacterium]|nr:hypothetical protein [Azospirillaceae bacterium]